MFSNANTKCMYSDSVAQACGAKVQSPRKVCAELITRKLFCNFFYAFFKGACDNVIHATNIFPNSY